MQRRGSPLHSREWGSPQLVSRGTAACVEVGEQGDHLHGISPSGSHCSGPLLVQATQGETPSYLEVGQPDY